MSNKTNKGGNVPKLRFLEFRDAPEWSKEQLGGTVSLKVRKRTKPQMPYKGLGLRSHGKGTFLKNDEAPEKNSMEYLYEVHADDLVVNITFAWEGALAIASQEDDGALVSHRFPTYIFKKKVAIPQFFRYLILDKIFIYRLGVISPGGAGRNRVLNKTDFLKLSVLIPKVDEQQKIADCLSSIDELIVARTQKLDALKAHKKGLMQQLFPAEGETVPKLRFPEFRDESEWEEKTLGGIASFYKGKGISKADVEQNGNTPCIRYGELYTKYTAVIAVVESRTNLPVDELFLSKKNDVLIPSSGETKLDIATASCVGLDGVALGGDINVLRSKQDGIFLSYYLNAKKKFQIAKIAQGDTIVHLYSSQLKGIEVVTPKPKEQKKIADCLSSIDDLIFAQTQEIESLKAHKKGLMQQLFPSADEAHG